MKKLQKHTLRHLAILAFGLIASPLAHADDLFYVGPKVGFMTQDLSCTSDCIGAAMMGGITVGYNLLGKNAQFPMDMGGLSLALEGELANSLTDFTYTGSFGLYDISWKTKTQSLYTVFRYDFNDKFFAQARVGRTNYKTTGETTVSGFTPIPFEYSYKENGYGLGGGINFSSSQIRLDLTSGGSKSKLTSVAFAYMLKF